MPIPAWRNSTGSTVMCDYSLEMYKSRPAKVGEKLTLERFPSGSQGFTTNPGPSCNTAACVLPGATLHLQGISPQIQAELGVGSKERVTMTRIESYIYKDAVRFENGQCVTLQRLNRGVTAELIQDFDKLLKLDEAVDDGDSGSAIVRRELVQA